jgi:hypothetical protein
MGSYSNNVTTYESTLLPNNPVAFYGHLHLQYRTINGIGIVIQENKNNLTF